MKQKEKSLKEDSKNGNLKLKESIQTFSESGIPVKAKVTPILVKLAEVQKRLQAIDEPDQESLKRERERINALGYQISIPEEEEEINKQTLESSNFRDKCLNVANEAEELSKILGEKMLKKKEEVEELKKKLVEIEELGEQFNEAEEQLKREKDEESELCAQELTRKTYEMFKTFQNRLAEKEFNDSRNIFHVDSVPEPSGLKLSDEHATFSFYYDKELSRPIDALGIFNQTRLFGVVYYRPDRGQRVLISVMAKDYYVEKKTALDQKLSKEDKETQAHAKRVIHSSIKNVPMGALIKQLTDGESLSWTIFCHVQIHNRDYQTISIESASLYEDLFTKVKVHNGRFAHNDVFPMLVTITKNRHFKGRIRMFSGSQNFTFEVRDLKYGLGFFNVWFHV